LISERDPFIFLLFHDIALIDVVCPVVCGIFTIILYWYRIDIESGPVFDMVIKYFSFALIALRVS